MANKAALGTIQFGDTPAQVGQVRSYNAPSEASEIDTTVMGTNYSSFLPGTIGVRVECELFLEPADAGQVLALAQLASDVPQDLTVQPTGAGSGNSQLSGKATVLSYNVQASADGAVELAINFAGDGANPLVWSVQV